MRKPIGDNWTNFFMSLTCNGIEVISMLRYVCAKHLPSGAKVIENTHEEIRSIALQRGIKKPERIRSK